MGNSSAMVVACHFKDFSQAAPCRALPAACDFGGSGIPFPLHGIQTRVSLDSALQSHSIHLQRSQLPSECGLDYEHYPSLWTLYLSWDSDFQFGFSFAAIKKIKDGFPPPLPTLTQTMDSSSLHYPVGCCSLINSQAQMSSLYSLPLDSFLTR